MPPTWIRVKLTFNSRTHPIACNIVIIIILLFIITVVYLVHVTPFCVSPVMPSFAFRYAGYIFFVDMSTQSSTFFRAACYQTNIAVSKFDCWPFTMFVPPLTFYVIQINQCQIRGIFLIRLGNNCLLYVMWQLPGVFTFGAIDIAFSPFNHISV